MEDRWRRRPEVAATFDVTLDDPMPESRVIRIATRESRLALAQAGLVREALVARNPGLEVQLVGMTTRGDRILDRPLAQVGGKGLFIKELEVALTAGSADVAVHSLKDVPMELAPEFALATLGPREDPLDAFVSNRFARLEELPPGSVVGTSSLRRECQLRHHHRGLHMRPLRGNVNTRLAKLDADQYDAIILAAAGLRRLGLEARIRTTLPATIALPAIGQGILAVEWVRARRDMAQLLSPLEEPQVAVAAAAERALGRVVEGSCEVPVGAFAQVEDGKLALQGFIGLPDGSQLVRDSVAGATSQAESLGHQLGERLLASGGREILDQLMRLRA
jgi:hydroxymethylbilane synthase